MSLDEQAAKLPEDIRLRRIRNAERALKGYQGYDNYETWAFLLWMSDSNYSLSMWTDTARRILEKKNTSEVWTDEEFYKFTLADMLKDSFEEKFERESQKLLPMFLGIFRGAFDNINWNEVAERLISGFRE